jgi:hypothetical protein
MTSNSSSNGWLHELQLGGKSYSALKKDQLPVEVTDSHNSCTSRCPGLMVCSCWLQPQLPSCRWSANTLGKQRQMYSLQTCKDHS